MNEQNLKACGLMTANREIIKKSFPLDNGMIHICCAAVYSSKGLTADAEKLLKCRDLLKSQVKFSSEFMGNAKIPIISMIAADDDPELTLKNSIQIYDLLKKKLRRSNYLPFTALTIAQLAAPDDYERIIGRTGNIFSLMKKEHPFLTSDEDNAFCALMALSEKTDSELIDDMEQCYIILKKHFFNSNAVQSLSHVLALCEGTPADKCAKVLELFNLFKNEKRRYGTDYELASLGVLAMSGAPLNETVRDTLEIDGLLSSQKGFGAMSLGKKQRLMYAGILAGSKFSDSVSASTAAVNSTISAVISQQISVMCACIASASIAISSSAAR